MIGAGNEKITFPPNDNRIDDPVSMWLSRPFLPGSNRYTTLPDSSAGGTPNAHPRIRARAYPDGDRK